MAQSRDAAPAKPAKSDAAVTRAARSFKGVFDPHFEGRAIAEKSDQRLFINSVEKALRVLYAFDDSRKSLTIASIAESTKLGRSGAQRFVYTLEKLGYLRKDPETRRYRLSPRVLDFAAAYMRTDELAPLLIEHFSELNHACGESVTLHEPDGTEIVIVTRLASRHMFGAHFFTGMRSPAFCASAGRAIMAFLPAARAIDIIDRSERPAFTKHTITDKEGILAELAKVRRDGYCIAEQESVADTISIGVPVFDYTRLPVAAVNIFVPLSRWPRARMARELAPAMMRAARAFSRSLGAP